MPSKQKRRPLHNVTNNNNVDDDARDQHIVKRSKRDSLSKTKVNYKEHSDDDESSIEKDESSYSSNEDIESG